MNDKALEFNSYLIEVRDLIFKVKNIGLDISNYQKEYENIEKSIKNKVHNFLNDSKDNILEEATLEMIYQKGIKELDDMKFQLNQNYKEYYRIYNIKNNINNYLNNCDSNELYKYIDKSVKVLELLNKSSTIDLSVEEPLINAVYKNVYYILLLESVYSNKSILLNYIKDSHIHSKYINSLLNIDLNNLDVGLKDEIIVKTTLDSSLLDKNIVSLIAKNSDDINDILNMNTVDIEEYYNQYGNRLEDLLERIKKIEDNDLEKTIKKIGRKLTGLRIRSVAVLVGILSVGVPTYKLCKDMSYYEAYRTYDTETILETGEETILNGSNDYRKEEKYTAEVSEYSPWIERKLTPKYYRIVNHYTFENPEKDNLDFNIDIAYRRDSTVGDNSQETSVERSPNIYKDKPLIETKDILDEGDETTRNTTVLHQLYQDKSDTRKVLSNKMLIFTLILFYGVELTGFILYQLINHSKRKAWKEIREDSSLDLKYQKQELLECKTKYNTLLDEIHRMETEINNDVYSEEEKEKIKLLSKKYDKINC